MIEKQDIRLGVNIDHVATLRNARGGIHPDPLDVALMLERAGDTDLITVHLREDRRHIKDDDVYKIKKSVGLPLNLEMAMTEDMLNIALDVKPDWVCIVPEKREEVTTEGGLAIDPIQDQLRDFIARLQDNGSKVSLFIDPNEMAVSLSKESGANAVELHTGSYAHDRSKLSDIQNAATICQKLNLQCHAGHGLTYDNVMDISAIDAIEELNIGYFLIGEALKTGLTDSVSKMKKLMLASRTR